MDPIGLCKAESLRGIKLDTDHLGSCYFSFLKEALKSKNTACLDEYANLLNSRLFSVLLYCGLIVAAQAP